MRHIAARVKARARRQTKIRRVSWFHGGVAGAYAGTCRRIRAGVSARVIVAVAFRFVHGGLEPSRCQYQERYPQ